MTARSARVIARLRWLAATACLPAALGVAWWVASDGSKSFYVPPLRTIVAAIGPTWAPRLASDVMPSIARLLAGYAGAVIVGVGRGRLR